MWRFLEAAQNIDFHPQGVVFFLQGSKYLLLNQSKKSAEFLSPMPFNLREVCYNRRGFVLRWQSAFFFIIIILKSKVILDSASKLVISIFFF